MKVIKFMMMALMMCFAMTSFSQERVNRQKLKWEAESLTLTKSIGWCYNDFIGEWLDYENVMCPLKEYKTEYKSLLGRHMMSKYSQNFIKIQTKLVKLNDNSYYVLIVEKWDGAYEYPSLQRDWYSFKSTIGFIFNETEYKKIENIDGVVEIKTTKIVDPILMFQSDYNDQIFLDEVQNQLLSKEEKYAIEYTFPILRAKDGNIRFYLPDTKKYDFSKKYFETDYENFSKIILK